MPANMLVSDTVLQFPTQESSSAVFGTREWIL